nr:hypothetical protein [Tanacetum cinerariifolium]
MFDVYFNPLTIIVSSVPVVAAPRAIDLANSPVSTSIDQDAPSTIIKESLVKAKQKGAILNLKQRHLKNIIFCYYTPYPAMKIRHISASSAQETHNDQFSIRSTTLHRYVICTAGRQSKIQS